MIDTDGAELISAVVIDGSVEKYLKLGMKQEYFSDDEKPIFVLLDEFVRKFGKLPAFETLEELAGKPGLPKKVVEPAGFYLDKVKLRYTAKKIERVWDDLKEIYEDKSLSKTTNMLKKLEDLTFSLMATEAGAKLVDLRAAVETVEATIKAKQVATHFGIGMGWPSLDGQTFGLLAGDMVSVVGRPATGKTFLLMYSAMTAWREQGKIPLVVSMEMSVPLLAERLAAIASGINLSHLKKGQFTKASFKDTKGVLITLDESLMFKKAMTKVKTAAQPFYIVDANMAATVDDIFALCRYLKPDVVYVDGAYLLKHKSRMDRYQRVAENCDMLKQMIASEIGVPTLCSWQFSREAVKKMKKGGADDLGLEDIGYSDAIGQHSSIVLGLLEEEDGNVEVMKKRKVTIMKGRSGEVGSFYVRWDFQKMDFSEMLPLGTTKEQILSFT